MRILSRQCLQTFFGVKSFVTLKDGRNFSGYLILIYPTQKRFNKIKKLIFLKDVYAEEKDLKKIQINFEEIKKIRMVMGKK